MTARIFLALAAAASAPPAAAEPSPFLAQPRSFEQFAPLLRRSPFTVPTAEESSPLAERFALTGAAVLDGEEQIFVLDRTTLIRERVTRAPGESGLQLVELFPDPDPLRMRASIRFGNQTATIVFQEPPAAPAAKAAAAAAPARVTVPALAKTPSPNRRIIIRSKISGRSASIP